MWETVQILCQMDKILRSEEAPVAWDLEWVKYDSDKAATSWRNQVNRVVTLACGKQFKAVRVVKVADATPAWIGPALTLPRDTADGCCIFQQILSAFTCTKLHVSIFLFDLPVRASSVKAWCTNSWSVGELSPSSGGWGCILLLGCKHPPRVLLGAGTPRRYNAASSALPWTSRSLSKTEVDLGKTTLTQTL